MDYETKQANLKVKKVFGTDEFAVNGKINIEEDSIKKILFVNAISSVQSFECLDTNCNVNGRIQVSASYVLQDDTVKNVLADFPYQTNMQVLSQDISVSAEVKEVKFEQSQNSIDASILVNLVAVGTENQEITELESHDENCVLRQEEILATSMVNMGEGKFTQSVAVELSKQNAQILYVNANNKIIKTESFVDEITVSAICTVKVGYVFENNFYEETKNIEFDQEISCLNALPNMFTAAKLKVSGINYVQDSQNVNIVVSMIAEVSCYNQQMFNITKDAYSIKEELQINYECKNHSNFIVQKYEESTIAASIDTLKDATVLGLSNAMLKIAKTEVANGQLFIDCILNAKGIYKLAESEEINACDINIPAVIKVETSAKSVDDVSVEITSVSIKKSNEIDAKVFVSFSEREETYIEYVSSIKETAEKNDDKSAITIYVAKPNQTIFDVAKALNVLPKSVDSSQIVDGKFNGGEKIFVYNPIYAEF